MATKRPEDHVHLKRSSRSYNINSMVTQNNDDIELTVQKIRAREHRGTLEDALKTQTVIPGTIEGVEEWVKKIHPEIDIELIRDNLTIETYSTVDRRTGWMWTRNVSVEGYGVIGQIDWKTPKMKRKESR